MTIRIGARVVGRGRPCYVIAEAGFNHLGDVRVAHELVRAARRAGADAVKFQTFRAGDIALTSTAHYRTLAAAELSAADFAALRDTAASEGITFLSTPFSESAADLLEGLDVPAYKVASMDLTNLPLLRHLAGKGRPLIVSTGMGTLGEIEVALTTIRETGNDTVVLLHCVSEYPVDIRRAGLRAITTLAQAFDVPVGYSDHTEGPVAPLAAVALGACVLEKHFTLDRRHPGADNSMSIEPAELTALVADIRGLEEGLGTAPKRLGATELEGRRLYRRGLHARVPIAKGTTITAAMVKAVRPAAGVPPERAGEVLARVARVDIAEEVPITPAMVD